MSCVRDVLPVASERQAVRMARHEGRASDGFMAEVARLFVPAQKLALLGFALALVWEACFYEVAASAFAGGFPTHVYRVAEAVVALATVVAVCACVDRRRVTRALELACVASALSGLVLMLAPVSWLCVAAIVVGGAGICAASLLWMHTYVGIDVRQGLAYLLLAFLASELLEPLATLVFVAPVGCVALPLVTPALVRFARSGRALPAWRPAEGAVRPRVRELLPLVGILLFGIVLGVVQGSFSLPYGHVPARLWATGCKAGVFLALLVAFVASGRCGFSVQVVAVGALALVVVLFLLLSLFGGDSYVLRVFLSVTRKTITLLFFCLLVFVASGAAASPMAILGCGLSLHALGSALGSYLGASLADYLTSATFLLAMVLAALVACALLLACRIGPDETTPPEPQELAPAPPLSPARLSGRCREVGETCGLTPREIEVIQLYCQGMPRAVIAERLCISENTARAHIKRAYAKLDVHSRAELLALLGVEMRMAR